MDVRKSATAAALITLAAIGGAAQTPLLRVSGIVADARSGDPIGGAVVTMSGRGAPPRRVVVEPGGRFVFSDLPAGIYSVQASKPGYAGGGAGQDRADGLPAPIDVTSVAGVTGVRLLLWKLGAIEGSVTGDASEPLAGIDVHALRRSLIGGRWRLIDAGSAATDDRGRYRVASLPPGDYAVAARPPRTRDVALLLATLAANPTMAADVMTAATMSGHGNPELDPRVRDYPLTFYPAAASPARAVLVGLQAGAERTGLDFHLRAGRVVRVSGMAAGPGIAAGLTVRLLPADTDLATSSLEAAAATCDDEGHFAFSAVTPGRYVATLLPNDAAVWARTLVVVGASDASGLTMQTHAGLEVRGRVDAAGDSPPSPTELSQMAVRLDSIDEPPPSGGAPAARGHIDADGRFVTTGVPPGEYMLRVSSIPRGWTLRSALAGGLDLLDRPVTIGDHDVDGVTILLDRRPLASVAGTIRDDAGRPRGDATVLAFPVERDGWRDSTPLARRLRAVRPLSSGAFGLQGLPSGDYFVVAIAGDPPAGWQDPVRLESWSRQATRVHLDAGAPQRLDLQVRK